MKVFLLSPTPFCWFVLSAKDEKSYKIETGKPPALESGHLVNNIFD
jgi:hypothetical protein